MVLDRQQDDSGFMTLAKATDYNLFLSPDARENPRRCS